MLKNGMWVRGSVLKKVYICLLILLLVVASATSYVKWRDKRLDQAVVRLCSSQTNSDLLGKIANQPTEELQNQLQQLSQTISQTKRSASSPDCSYMSAYYYLSIGDSQNAGIYLKKLKSSAKTVTLKNTLSLSDLEDSINAIQSSREDVIKNTKTFGSP